MSMRASVWREITALRESAADAGAKADAPVRHERSTSLAAIAFSFCSFREASETSERHRAHLSSAISGGVKALNSLRVFCAFKTGSAVQQR